MRTLLGKMNILNRSLPALAAFLLLSSAAMVAQVPHSDHVIIITLENTSYERVIGNTACPFSNSWVLHFGLPIFTFARRQISLPPLLCLRPGRQFPPKTFPPKNSN